MLSLNIKSSDFNWKNKCYLSVSGYTTATTTTATSAAAALKEGSETDLKKARKRYIKGERKINWLVPTCHRHSSATQKCILRHSLTLQRWHALLMELWCLKDCLLCSLQSPMNDNTICTSSGRNIRICNQLYNKTHFHFIQNQFSFSTLLYTTLYFSCCLLLSCFQMSTLNFLSYSKSIIFIANS